MADLPNSESSLLASDLEPEDLHAILDRIDENLAFWQVLYNDRVLPQGVDAVVPNLPSLEPLYATSYWLKMSSAPLRPSMGVGGVHGIVIRLSNLVVRVFGAAQIGFNRQLRDFLGELLPAVQALYAHAAALKPIVSDLDHKMEYISDLEARVQTLEASNAAYQKEIDMLSGQVATLRGDLDKLLAQGDDAGRAKPV